MAYLRSASCKAHSNPTLLITTDIAACCAKALYYIVQLIVHLIANVSNQYNITLAKLLACKRHFLPHAMYHTFLRR